MKSKALPALTSAKNAPPPLPAKFKPCFPENTKLDPKAHCLQHDDALASEHAGDAEIGVSAS